MLFLSLFFFLIPRICLLIFRERKESGGETDHQTDIDVREKHQLVASRVHPDQVSNPQPGCVPWSGMEPVVFGVQDDAPPDHAPCPGHPVLLS